MARKSLPVRAMCRAPGLTLELPSLPDDKGQSCPSGQAGLSPSVQPTCLPTDAHGVPGRLHPPRTGQP